MSRRVLLLGATGLVGGECLRQLLLEPDVERVIVLARRPVPCGDPRVDARVVDFDALDKIDPEVFVVDQVFCALGTTIKAAGSQEAFRRVDFDYPVRVGRLARDHGARHYLLVSALGAEVRSRIFYNRVKGDVEQAVRALGYPSLTVLRPSLLLGDRPEFRLGERIAKVVSPLIPGRYRGVQARDVARAMIIAARDARPGTRVLESDEIRRIAQNS
jgi:uncharacterized protein YbjT (DUF2867 family)